MLLALLCLCTFVTRHNCKLIDAYEEVGRSNQFSQGGGLQLRQKRESTVNNVPALRTRNPGEIIPLSAEQSVAYNGKTADRSIDLNFTTTSVSTNSDKDDPVWFQVLFDRVYCISEVYRYKKNGEIAQSWTCTGDNCTCVPVNNGCIFDDLIVAVDGEVTEPVLSRPDCMYGNFVKLQLNETDSQLRKALGIAEYAVIGKAICPVGMSENSTKHCNPCPADHYSDGEESCKKCPAGTTPNEDQDECEMCKAGTAKNSNMSECTMCVGNSISSMGSAVCAECSADTTANELKTQCECRSGCEASLTILRGLVGVLCLACFILTVYTAREKLGRWIRSTGWIRCWTVEPEQEFTEISLPPIAIPPKQTASTSKK